MKQQRCVLFMIKIMCTLLFQLNVNLIPVYCSCILYINILQSTSLINLILYVHVLYIIIVRVQILYLKKIRYSNVKIRKLSICSFHCARFCNVFTCTIYKIVLIPLMKYFSYVFFFYFQKFHIIVWQIDVVFKYL